MRLLTPQVLKALAIAACALGSTVAAVALYVHENRRG